MSDVTLATPYLIAAAETLSLPADGTATSGPVNAAIAWTKRHSKTRLLLPEAPITASLPIDLTSDVELIGTGIPCSDPTKWGGGTTIRLPLNSRSAAVRALGSNKAEGSVGMLQRIRLKNMAVYGAIQAWEATRCVPATPEQPISQAALIDIQDVAYFLGEDLWMGQDYRRALRLSGVWDSDIVRPTFTNGCGFSDPSALPDDPAVRAYLGRDALPIEHALGFSLGMAAFEIISPAGRGGNAANSIRVYSMRSESNASNGVSVLIYGPNTNIIRFIGCKIETVEGCCPVLAVDGAVDVAFDGELMGGARGAPLNDICSIAAGTPWANFVQSAIAVFHGCNSPRLTGSISHAGGPAHTEALLRFVGTANPSVNMTVADGLANVTKARMIFDACRNVSVAQTRCYADDYVLAAAGANQLEHMLINGTTIVH